VAVTYPEVVLKMLEMVVRVVGGMMSRRARRRSERVSSSVGRASSSSEEISESVGRRVLEMRVMDEGEGGCTSVGVVVFLVVGADLLCLEGLVLDFDEFDHCGWVVGLGVWWVMRRAGGDG
jgi:hypothetical protein